METFSPPLPYYVQKTALCNPGLATHHETYFTGTVVSTVRKKKEIGVETVIDVTNAKPALLARVVARCSLVAVQRRGLTLTKTPLSFILEFCFYA